MFHKKGAFNIIIFVTIDSKLQRYYSTYRSKKYDPNSWKDHLRIDKIREVEGNCSLIMEKFGYIHI